MANLKILYLVRHRQYYTDTGDLTDLGRTQAKKLASLFKSKKLNSLNTTVVSCSYLRAKNTAMPTAQKVGKPLQVERVFDGWRDEGDWMVDYEGSKTFIKNHTGSPVLVVVAHYEHTKPLAKLLVSGDFKKTEQKSSFGGDMVKINFERKTITYYE